MNREKLYTMLLLSMALTVGMGIGAACAENIDPNNDDSQYAYGENVGFLNFEPGGNGGSGAEVTDTKVTGYAWAENIGWLNLSPTSFGGVVNDGTGILSGYAWGENVGWINFKPAGGGVTIDANGNFDGYAWGENIGWIHFKNNAIPYKVQTSWKPLVVSTPTPTASPTPTLSPEPTVVASPIPQITPSPIPSPTESPTVITLLSFEAKAGDDGSVILTWETATEVDNAGFNLYRARHKHGAYTKINDTLIPAKGNATTGASYNFTDTPPAKGTYFYKLEDVDKNGGSTKHDPEKVRVRIK